LTFGTAFLQRIACGQRTEKQQGCPKSACFTGYLNNKATLLPIQALYQKQSGNMSNDGNIDTIARLLQQYCAGSISVLIVTNSKEVAPFHEMI